MIPRRRKRARARKRVVVERTYCESCKRENNALPFATKDATRWDSIPGGWLYFVRNGVVILACSATCAERYIEGIGIR